MEYTVEIKFDIKKWNNSKDLQMCFNLIFPIQFLHIYQTINKCITYPFYYVNISRISHTQRHHMVNTEHPLELRYTYNTTKMNKTSTWLIKAKENSKHWNISALYPSPQILMKPSKNKTCHICRDFPTCLLFNHINKFYQFLTSSYKSLTKFN